MRILFSSSVFAFALAVASLLFTAQSAHASADSSCYPDWDIYSRDLSCASSAVISPGNDTRSNLLLLLMDGRGGTKANSYPDLGWDRSYGRNFFNWSLMRDAFYPAQADEDDGNNYYGSRCVSFPSGSDAFRRALAANAAISAQDRKTLEDMRGFIEDVCKGKDYWGRPPDDLPEVMSNTGSVLGALKLGNAEATEYLDYLKAAAAFYGGDFDTAASEFASLKSSKDGWLKETATYMIARVHLNAAQENSFNKWGDFEGVDAIDIEEANKAEKGLLSYLGAYPSGRYAASAQGLKRRIFWLRQDLDSLASEYVRLMGNERQESTPDLVEEIDLKLLFENGAEGKVNEPVLLAVIDLMRMRDDEYDNRKNMTRAEIEAQKDRFAGHEALFDFLLANHAFYVEGNAKRVLELIPDAARQENFSYLEFSRQALRGAALQMLKDPNEGGFWRDVLTGAKSLYQRPAAELGLAIFYEQKGQLDKIFASDSPIREAGIRKILLHQVAGPAILRAAAVDSSRPREETDLALFTLLYKNLSRGNYAEFLKDQANIPANANDDAGLWNLAMTEEIPVGRFGDGAQKGEYTCPSLRATVTVLARAPKDSKARLCLGDFWLANGFDDYFYDYPQSMYRGEGDKPPLPELGQSKSQFAGSAIPRHDFYTQIMADPRAKADERAYALYRAIRCYATSGNNSCGGEAVEESQRKAWFQRLKRDYPQSVWAKKLKYYW